MAKARASRDGHRGGLWGLILVAGLVGAVLVTVAVVAQQPDAPRLEEPVGSLEPSPTEAAPGQDAEPPAEVTPARRTPLGPSRPVGIEIPAIDVTSTVIPIGKNPDGTLAVPQPGPDLDKAAWFENSPTPGQPGPSIIEGHVATEEGGPSIFFDLAALRPGDTVEVQRRDGRILVFEVEALREFAKDRFPTELVYGGALSTPTLRLITCSNFDPTLGGHTSNLVVFARLTEVKGAGLAD